MAATDASALPMRGQAWRATFPIFDADGDLVTAAGSLDSEISKDQGTFADCSNEATEIATSSGMYYLDLTATEMDADTIAIIVKSTGGKTTPIVVYPGTPLAHSQASIVKGTIDTTVAPSTTEFECDDITEATADHYNGRVVIFTSGALAGEARTISDYSLSGGRGHFTVDTAMTDTPGNNDTLVIV